MKAISENNIRLRKYQKEKPIIENNGGGGESGVT